MPRTTPGSTADCMFTGLVEATSEIVAVEKKDFGARLHLHPPAFAGEMQKGESIALDGCCLTLNESTPSFTFDLLQETLDRTNLGKRNPGDRINLERAVRADQRMGGHFVQGHIDATTKVLTCRERGEDFFWEFAIPSGAAGLFVEKGSIAVNGVSLTVATLGTSSFGVWLIPHTRLETNLGDLGEGDWVNLEYDVLAKHVARLLEMRLPSR